ncbi:MAG: HAMP domain-containing sensor histidine kinase [Bacillota bacterium]|nr:HAMP domain-containing sensor histidine kinase [Bacillota bacterium]
MEWMTVNLPIILPIVAIPFVLFLAYVYQKAMRFAHQRLENELLHLNDQLVSLNTLSKCLAGSAELRPTMEIAVGELMNTLRLSYCQINSVVSASGDLLPTLCLGVPPTGKPDVLELIAREAEQSQASLLKGLVAALPIRVLDRTVGSMVAVFQDDSVIEKRLKVVETFTQQLAAVLYAVTLLHKERETTERMTELTRLRGDFVAMVSHELRTPLTCIKGFVDTLLRPGMHWEAEDEAEFLQSIKVSTEQALNVVEDLLAVQQAEYGKLAIHREPLDLIVLIEEACRRAQSISHSHAIRWSIPSQPLVIKADATRLTQVMDNLLSNSIKYSPLGGDVVVKVKQQEGCVEVSVADTGIGIQPEHQTLIFEKFFRADNTAARRTEGLGLGLSIVQAIVALHGGKVWLTSAPNKGSTFYFTLPN